MFQLIRKTDYFQGGSIEIVYDEKAELTQSDLEEVERLNELVSITNKKAKEKFAYIGGEAHWEWKEKLLE